MNVNERQKKTSHREMRVVGLTCLNFRAVRNVVRKMVKTNNEFAGNLKNKKECFCKSAICRRMYEISIDIYHSQQRHGLETRLKSLFDLFVRVYANLCTVKTMEFLHNEAIVQWHHLAKLLNRTVEILIRKISKDLCTVKLSQHQILAHYRRFEVCQVSRPCLCWLCIYTTGLLILYDQQSKFWSHWRHLGTPGQCALRVWSTIFHRCCHGFN